MTQFTLYAHGRIVGHLMADTAENAVRKFVAVEGYSVATVRAVATQAGR